MSEQTIVWDLALIQKYNYSGPRYTSYPTALEFNQRYDEAAFQRAAARYPERPLSLYVHIPFCHKLCYFCGCNKLVTRQTHKADEYLNVLAQEIASRAPLFAGRKVGQMHWGGGTPTYLDKAQISRLVALLRERQISLIEDDVYGELYFSAERPLPAKALDSGGQILHCSSFSKCLAPGFRVGWVAAGRYAQQIQRLQLMSTVSTSVPTQMALADYLLHGGYDTHLRRLRRLLAQRQSAMRQAIAHHFPPTVKVSQPDGGYFLWLELDPALSSMELYRRALARGISIAPGRMFTTGDHFNHCFRLNASFEWNDRFEEAIKTLAKLIRGLAAAG